MRAFVASVILIVLACVYTQMRLEYPKPEFEARLLTISPAYPVENEEITVKIEVIRLSVPGSCKVELLVDNSPLERELLVRGINRYIYFSFPLSQGSHRISFENKFFHIHVSPTTWVENVEILVKDFSVEPLDVKLWEEAYVRVRLENPSQNDGWKTVRVWIGETLHQRRVLVKGGESKDIYFHFTADVLTPLTIRVEECPKPPENFRPSLL